TVTAHHAFSHHSRPPSPRSSGPSTSGPSDKPSAPWGFTRCDYDVLVVNNQRLKDRLAVQEEYL
ncbi:hypothetical protein U1Q18_014102, partial [Sarracenia purpurea var. burkii]